MRTRTPLAITLTMFVLPALAAQPVMPSPRALPTPVPAARESSESSLSFEVRAVRAPVGFCEKVGVKPTAGAVLTDAQLLRVIEAARELPDANVVQHPKLTTADGQTATIRCTEPQLFVTTLEVTKVKGQTVFVPKNVPIDLGDIVTLTGHLLADQKRVSVRANWERTALAGTVELVPVVTQVTPIFEGGSMGTPIPVTQFLQAPEVKTDKAEKTAIVANGETFVLGVWKETAEPKADRPEKGKSASKKEKPAECELAVLVTVRVLPTPADAPRELETALAPLPHAAPALATKVFEVCDLVLPVDVKGGETIETGADKLVKFIKGHTRPSSWQDNGGRGDAEFFPFGCALVVRNSPAVVAEVAELLEAERRLREQPTATAPAAPNDSGTLPVGAIKYKLRNVAAADAAGALAAFVNQNRLDARITFDLAENSVVVSAEPILQRNLGTILAAADKPLPQVMARVMVVQVPRGFVAGAGLNPGTDAGERFWVLSPREERLLTSLFRAAKERGELDVLGRPQLQVCDNQTGRVRVGQEYPSLTGYDVKTVGGVASLVPKTETVPLGVTLELTPRVAPDGTTVLVRTDFRLTEVTGQTPLKLNSNDGAAAAQVGSVTTFATHAVRETAEVKFGHTLVLVAEPVGSEAKVETLVLVTPEQVRP